MEVLENSINCSLFDMNIHWVGVKVKRKTIKKEDILQALFSHSK